MKFSLLAVATLASFALANETGIAKRTWDLEPAPSKPEEPKAPGPKPGEPKPGPPAPRPEKPKPETPQPETPKPEEPKPETPKPEEPKPEEPKPQPPAPQPPKDCKPLENEWKTCKTLEVDYTKKHYGCLAVESKLKKDYDICMFLFGRWFSWKCSSKKTAYESQRAQCFNCGGWLDSKKAECTGLWNELTQCKA